MTVLDQLLETRATLKATSADPMHAWLVDALTGGQRTLSGESVSPRSALSVSAYFAAIRAISEDVGKLPLPVYERIEQGTKHGARDYCDENGRAGKRRVINNPLYRLIHDEPNPEMSSQTFREVLTQHAMGWGNGFAEIQRRGEVPVALWPLDPANVRLEREKDTRLLVYKVRHDTSGSEVSLRAVDVLHIHGLGFDGVTGYSVAKLAKQTIGLAGVQEKSGAAYFGNANRPAGLLETPANLKPEQKKALREGFEHIHQGVESAHRTAVLEGGVTFKPISIPNKDAEWIAAREFSVSDIARWFRIPPHKIAHLINATYSNISHQSIEYVQDTLLGWLKRWESEIWRKLIPRVDQPHLFAEHIVEGLLRGDPEQQSKLFASGRQWGYYSANDVLAMQNRNPIGPEGDVYLSPVNMVPAHQLGTPQHMASLAPAPTTLPGIPPSIIMRDRELIEAHLPQFVKVFNRVVSLQCDRAEQAIKTNTLSEWLSAFYVPHAEAMRELLIEVVRAFVGSAWALRKDGSMPFMLESGMTRRIEAFVGEYVAQCHHKLSIVPNNPKKIISVWRDTQANNLSQKLLHLLVADVREVADAA